LAVLVTLSVSVQLIEFKIPVKVKVKVHTLDIVPLRSESPLQKHSVVSAAQYFKYMYLKYVLDVICV